MIRIAAIVGDSDDNTLTGNGKANTLKGLDGNDTLSGLGGDDVLKGGTGNDKLYAGSGADTLLGGTGDDLIYMAGSYGAGDTINGGDGNDNVYLTDTSHKLVLSNMQNVEHLNLSDGNYRIVTADSTVAAEQEMSFASDKIAEHSSRTVAFTGTLIFNGSAETDGHFSVSGGTGNDHLIGGAEGDSLYGMRGNDRLDGGLGGDYLDGGNGRNTAGHDRFIYHSVAESTFNGGNITETMDQLRFDFARDKIVLPVTVEAIDPIVHGPLFNGGANADLFEETVNADALQAGHAVVFIPDADEGNSGWALLVVDANGEAGFQRGQDYVFQLAGSINSVDQLTLDNFA
jgi:Ca2+-binding RTX toxin-like protein